VIELRVWPDLGSYRLQTFHWEGKGMDTGFRRYDGLLGIGGNAGK